MKRLAVFVEGYTEILFVEKLLTEIAGKNKVEIIHSQIRGGSRVPRRMQTIRAVRPDIQAEYYVILYDCGNDSLVKGRLLEEHENLTQAGYSKLIGIRDVRPDFNYGEIPRLERNLRFGVKTKWAPVVFILAVMEIEAWFLAETSHFPKIRPAITVPSIIANLGFDPENSDMALRQSPADDLKDCYALGGQTYIKGQSQTTIDALDFALIYIELNKKIPYLNKLISELNTFFELP